MAALRRVFVKLATGFAGSVAGFGTSSPCIYPVSFLFEFLVSFPPSFHLGRNPILPRAGFLPSWCLPGWGRISAGGRCSSVISSSGRQCTPGLVGHGRTSEGSRCMFGGPAASARGIAGWRGLGDLVCPIVFIALSFYLKSSS